MAREYLSFGFNVVLSVVALEHDDGNQARA